MKKFAIIFSTLALLAIFFIGASFVFSNFAFLEIRGYSMFPTFTNRQQAVLRRIDEDVLNQIIVFNPHESWGPDEVYVKRIVAQPGNTLVITERNVALYDGDILLRQWLNHLEVPENKEIELSGFFVVGDNYNSSNDSLRQLKRGNPYFQIEESQVVVIGQLLGGRNE